MSIPPSPYSIVVEALAAVRDHPQHDLSLAYRQAVWAEFGPRIDDGQAVNSL